MLRLINKNEYQEILKSNGLNPDLVESKNHINFEFMKMMSEDGSEDLQGAIAAEMVQLSAGVVMNIKSLYIPEKYYGNNFGQILIYHLMEHVKDKYKNNEPALYSAMAIANDGNIKCFEENAFEITSPGKVLSNGKRSMIRVAKTF